MFAMHLCNFRQDSIDEVRQMMTRSPVKVPLSTETVKGVGWRLETLELRTPFEKFLATPLFEVDLNLIDNYTVSPKNRTRTLGQ